MMITATSVRKLDFDQLLHVYSDELINANDQENFYYYLLDFFKDQRACYHILVVDGIYVSALRTEPYRDGWIVAGLHTRREFRQRGYAKQLLTAACSELLRRGDIPIYSHVEKQNRASVRTHFVCGFSEIQDHAVFLDGSVSWNSYTLRCQ